METLFNNVDIVVFFFITVILIHRIYMVLGSRQGREVDVNHSRFNKVNKTVKAKNITDIKEVNPVVETDDIQKANSASNLYKKMLFVEKVFSDFDYIQFIKEKQEYFESIISAYHSKNLNEVKSKITDEYFETLNKASLSSSDNTNLIVKEFKEVDIVDIIFKQEGIDICVKFYTDYEIINNETKEVVEKDDSNVEYWLFKRTYQDTNWKLFDIKNEYN